ncbi:hypothetical protein FB45DRAFT_869866 [Roridomyces roridus]|uniref:RING-type domain-containing protein n=1 Tax=Roridomyces roridus TaxID=1738132 RepID=A0AAD7BJW0_9AGAR|nr:hypothetical protein FB45DRAFT_869866 [Roridomyces roridus]
MPKAATSARPSTRRSSRLNNQDPTAAQAAETTSMRLRRTRTARRSTRITPSELIRREMNLELRELEVKRKSDELDERSRSLSRKEDEAATILSQIATRQSKSILDDLEEHFTCPLCFEIMAQPFSLNPGACGHSFCALCILRHFFSRLHKACGGWHESVDCPMCRSLLVITPDRVPRLDITFPFVPNRTAAAMCEAMIEKLAQSSAGSHLVVKREESEGNWPPGSEWDMEWGRKKGRSKEEEELEVANSDLACWREGGKLRAEWLKRDREGKKEMQVLLTCWTTFRSQDFVDLKQRLGV